jgi:predicted metal-dependent hydrolase
LPPYAYLPGKQPHPVRDPAGHSYRHEPVTVAVEASLRSEMFRWGLDLFNHGYYWEAHEAWEPLWQGANQSTGHRRLFKGLILLAAAGVKIREGKQAAAARHAKRAAALFRQVVKEPLFETALGMPLAALADDAETAVSERALSPAVTHGPPVPVFDFMLGFPSEHERGG